MSNQLPELLKKKRLEKNLSQEEVAQRINKSLRAYQYYEDGDTTPKNDTLKRLEEVLGFKWGQVSEHATKLHADTPTNGVHVGDGQPDLLKAIERLTTTMEKLADGRIIELRAWENATRSHLLDSETIASMWAAMNRANISPLPPVGTLGTAQAKKQKSPEGLS